MSRVFASRRRAEEFASLVEGPRSGTPGDTDYAEFLSIVQGLREVPAPEPRPEFVGTLREQLMAAADTLLVPSDPERLALPARSPSRDRKLAAAIGGLAVVGASTSMALAAQSALPGEMLYPLKRVIENAEIGMTTESDAKAMTLLESASSRLDEMAALNREGVLADDTATAEASLVDFRDQALEGTGLLLDEYARTREQRLIRQLHAFTADSMDSLAQLEPLVPEGARDELIEAATTLAEIDARAERACPGCSGGGIDEVPPMLLTAGETTGRDLVVVPGTRMATPRGEAGRVGVRERDRLARQGRATTDAAPVDQPVDTSGVLTAPEDTPAGGGSRGDDPLDDLGAVLGGADTSTSDPGDLSDAVEDSAEEAGKTIDETVDDLTGPLTD